MSPDKLRKLIELEGYDPAAEERIILRIMEANRPPDDDWHNTDLLRHRIRKMQGRSNKG